MENIIKAKHSTISARVFRYTVYWGILNWVYSIFTLKLGFGILHDFEEKFGYSGDMFLGILV